MIGPIASEWLKVRTARSTRYIVLGLLLATIGPIVAAWNAAAIWDRLPEAGRATFSLAPLAALASWIAAFCMAVFGVLTITSEYSSRAISTTFITVPRRWAVLGAKGIVIAVTSFIVGQVVTFAAFFSARLIIDGRPIPGYGSPIADHLVFVVIMGVSVMVFALLGLGLGAITRSATAALVIVVALWHPITVIIAQDLPSPWNAVVASLVTAALPDQVAGTVSGGTMHGTMLSPHAALVAMAVYALVPLGAGTILAMMRDV